LPALLELRAASIGAVSSGYSRDVLDEWLEFDPSDRYLETIALENLLLACRDNSVLGCAGLHLPGSLLIATFVHPDAGGSGVGGRLLAAVEERAREFCLGKLLVESALNATPFYRSCGYEPATGPDQVISKRTGMAVDALEKSLSSGFTNYQRRITGLLKELDIPLTYGAIHALTVQPETSDLVTIGNDVFDREQFMAPEAAAAWKLMAQAAAQDNIDLLPVSAFRTVDYQAELIRRKISAAHSITEILRVSAAPGFSEHHSGRAIDVASNRENALEDCFEATPSFEWLSEHAAEFGYSMSYPRDNIHEIAYEPWHWAWHPA
jgi:D-alanyl-D-alanine carboxypeptidase